MSAPAEDGFESFAAAHPELLGPSRPFLEEHYRPGTLDAEPSRRRFVLPDRPPGPAGGN